MVSPHTPERPDAVPLRILIVDDDEDTAYSANILLKARGHEVESTLGGNTALSRVQLFVPDLVLLDLVMPGLDGIEVGREIRRMALPVEPALAAYSGLTTPAIRRECASAGFDHFVVKPAEMSELEQLIALVGRVPKEVNRFEQLAVRYEATAYGFTWSQLEFCGLVLDSLHYSSDRIIRQRQILRLHRVIALASAWLDRQTAMSSAHRYRMAEQLAKLRTQLAMAGA
jgi:CheY-like chemotaxis protein